MQLKIYYLDDEKDLQEMFSDIFSSTECSVTTFSDPVAFVNFVESNPPDLVFLDYRLPNCTGDEIAMKINPAIPKVLITGDLEVKPQASFVAKFGKPFETEELEALIQSFYKLKKAA